MTTLPTVEYFEQDKFTELISKIHKEINKTKKEIYFKEIAKDIIKSTDVLDSVREGPSVNEIQGVPFDLIGLKNNDLYIIELKGSDQNLNFPSEVQLARMEKVINQAKEINIELKPLLLQINLQYRFYCIWQSDFLVNRFKSINKKLGMARKIEPIIEWIKERFPNVKE